MQLRLQSGVTMHSERMMMPKWAKVAATRLSDEQIAFSQTEERPSGPKGSSGALSEIEDGGESVAGTVSRKGKFGFTCESCSFVPNKGDPEDWIESKRYVNAKSKYVALHFPDRCRKCRSRMKRWTCAARNYDKLELLRTLEGRHCLRFVTFTKKEWNVKIPASRKPGYEIPQDLTFSYLSSSKTTRTSDAWKHAEVMKKKAVKQFNNWRNRNKYWLSRDAKGQAYYECTMKPVWQGWGWDEVQLHFHIHTVVCSKRLENKDIQIDLDTLQEIPMSTTMQREWGGIVDVRACKTWKHKGEMKTSKRFVMNYLVDYINKSPHWQSTKFGDWSS